MAAITIDGLSDEVLAVLEEQAARRGSDVETLVRELIHVGVGVELARRDNLEYDFGACLDALSQPKPAELSEALGSFDTADPDRIWG